MSTSEGNTGSPGRADTPRFATPGRSKTPAEYQPDLKTYITKRLLFTTAPATFDNVCIVSAGLGAIVGAGLLVLILFPCWEVGLYAIAQGVFHLAEFWVTARYNSDKLGMSSFLLTNGIAYALAQFAACSELVLRRLVWKQSLDTRPFLTFVGFALVIGGQTLRSMSMIQAAKSFSHLLQHQRRDDHVLVTTGVYGVVRHPSYAAYFIWAVGCQIMVHNTTSVVIFAIVLWKFFQTRIVTEEESLVAMFGDKYKQYAHSTPSGLPFIK